MSSDIKAAHYRDRASELLARAGNEADPGERLRLTILSQEAAEKAERFEAIASAEDPG